MTIPLCIVVGAIAFMVGLVLGAVLTGRWYYDGDERRIKGTWYGPIENPPPPPDPPPLRVHFLPVNER